MKNSYLLKKTVEKKVGIIKKALEKSETLTVFTDCTISYSGRAESFLPRGDRLIIIKEDKTLLVHQPKGNNPINYMKPNTNHEVLADSGNFYLKSHNPILKEYLNIELHKIYSVNSQKLEDSKKIQIVGTEKDMAEMIYKNPELIEKGFKPLNMEEHTKYGFIDVFGYDKKNTLVVVECKRYTGDFKAVSQLRRYVEKIKKSKGIKEVRGVLACPKMSPNAAKMLEDFNFKFVKVNPPKYLEKFNKKQRLINEF